MSANKQKNCRQKEGREGGRPLLKEERKEGDQIRIHTILLQVLLTKVKIKNVLCAIRQHLELLPTITSCS